MEVIIKLTEPHHGFECGKEYKADKLKTGYFANSGQVSKLIPFDHAVEVEVNYSNL